MAWYDFLKTAGNNIQDGASSLFNKIKYVNEPTLPVLQMADNGEVDLQKSFELSMAQPKTPKENLLGRTFTINSEAQNPETGELEVSKVSKFQPGLLNDIRSGAKENFATGFAAPNWEQTVTPDGRKKGLGYRLGEGLGSMARFAESPLGRSLLMAGIVGVTGGGALPALTYGATTGMINQQARMKDKIYRNSLIEQGQNALRNQAGFADLTPEEQQLQLDEIANNINSIKGYVGDDAFKSVLAGMQLKDNAEYRNALLAGQRKDQEMAIQQRQAELEHKKLSEAADRALKKEQIDVQRQRYANNLNKLSSKDLTAYRDNLATIKDVEAGLNLIEQNPNAYSLVKGALPAWATNRIDPKGIQTRTQIDNITAVYRKWLTGAQMSDAERKAYERFLPAPTDNYETIKAKLQGMRDSIERKNSILMQGANEYQNMIDNEDNDPLGVR